MLAPHSLLHRVTHALADTVQMLGVLFEVTHHKIVVDLVIQISLGKRLTARFETVHQKGKEQKGNGQDDRFDQPIQEELGSCGNEPECQKFTKGNDEQNKGGFPHDGKSCDDLMEGASQRTQRVRPEPGDSSPEPTQQKEQERVLE